MTDLVHDPELFDSRSWLVIGRYKPLEIELSAPPRSMRKDPGAGATVPGFVRVSRGGRTGGSRRSEVYLSLRAAMASHGRWVRTSIEESRPTRDGTATRLEGVRVDQRGLA